MKACLAYLLFPLNYAAGACDWSSCQLKAAAIVGVCPSGQSTNGESKDCGSKTCLFGFCTYTHSEHMCCPDGDACAWHDTSCNWNALQGYFQSTVSDHAKQEFDKLAESVVDKLTTADKFKTLTLSELANLDTELLSELKSVVGMSLEQFKAVAEKVHEMAAPHLEDFLTNLSPGTLEQGLLSLGNLANWTEDKVSKIKDRLASTDLWGALTTWNSTKIEQLGSMISGLDLASLKSFADEALANAASVANLTSLQLGGLDEKLLGMSESLLSTMLEKVDNATLAGAMSQLTSVDRTWAAEQVALFKDHLESSDAWGAAKNWSSSMIGNLGSMMEKVDLETLLKFDDTSLAHAANLGKLAAQQLKSFGMKLYNMTSTNLKSMLTGLNASALAESIESITGVDLAWVAEQAGEFAQKLQESEAWGNITKWTSAQLEHLGSMLPSLPVNLTALIDDFSLSNAANLVKYSAEQLGKLGTKIFGMNITNLKSMLSGVNASALCGSLQGLTSTDYYWLPEKASAFQAKVLSPETCGQAAAWTKDKIGSLGSMLTSLNVSVIKDFGNAALARAENLKSLSAEKIDGLTDKIGSMDLSDFTPMLAGLDATGLHAAMLSQCDIQCEAKEDMEFLSNPNAANAATAFQSYAEKVKAKTNGAALAYAKGFCNGGANSYDEIFAEAQAAAIPCNGSAATNNVASTTFESFSDSQAGALLTELQTTEKFGSLTTWSEEQMSSLCHQYAALSPSSVAELSSSVLVSSSADVAMNAALVAAFGPLGPVADYAITKAADSITPEQRAAWSQKFKDGLGSLASWGCEQVASMKTMVAGLSADDLASLSMEAMKGLASNAISAMNSSQITGFSPGQIGSMVDKVRNRISGNLLKELNATQIAAVVCGALNTTAGISCPPAAIDLKMGFPVESLPNDADIIAHFANELGIPVAQVRILWKVNSSSLPETGITSRRRLSAETTQVAIRVEVSDLSQQANLTTHTQQAAGTLVSSNNGYITEDALSYSTTENVAMVTALLTSTSAGSAAATDTTPSGATPSSDSTTPAASTGSQSTGSQSMGSTGSTVSFGVRNGLTIWMLVLVKAKMLLL
jgi:hypothetical protein